MAQVPRQASFDGNACGHLVDLFAGAGGASPGLAGAGWRHIACVERHTAAAETLRAAGFPVVEGDLRDVDLAPWNGLVDLLWASPPCQPDSVVGLRRGALDERDGWPLLLGALDTIRPTWLVAENVLGWTRHDALCGGAAGACPACHLRSVLDHVSRAFAFSGAWVLDAASFGVPQHRRRVLIWGGPLPLPVTGPVPTHAAPESAADVGLLPWRTIGEAIGDTLHRGTCGRRACFPCDEDHGDTCSMPWRLDRPAPTVTTTEVKGTRASEGSGWTFHGGPDRASDTAFLIAGIRRIDVAEGMRLQGVPDDWPLQGGIAQRYTQVGNAVPPALAEAVGRLVRAAHVVWRDVQARGVDPVVLASALRRRPGAVAGGSAP